MRIMWYFNRIPTQTLKAARRVSYASQNVPQPPIPLQNEIALVMAPPVLNVYPKSLKGGQKPLH